jgi:hypothetical protein
MKRELGPELPSELRAELQRSRRAGHDYDVLAKLPQLRAALAAQSPADGPAEHGPASDPGRFTRVRLQLAPSVWKLVLLAATVGAVGATAFVVSRAPWRQARPAHSEQHASPTATTPPTAAPVAPAAIEAKPAATQAPASEAVAQQPAPSAQPLARSSRREIAQLVRIRALLEHDPTAAYRFAQQSEREFPHGVLSEERQALQVVALARSGSTEAAERRAREFFARYPQSPMRELVEASLRR